MSAPLRCHLHFIRVGPRTFRVIVPRPRDAFRISTNWFHETWHVLSAPHHVRTLRRLFWAMSFDRHADTLCLLDGELLLPTPFDGAPSLPVVIACSDRTHLRRADVAAVLERRARPCAPNATVKLLTFGLDAVDGLVGASRTQWLEALAYDGASCEPRVELVGGAIVFQGSAAALRHAAATTVFLEEPLRAGDMSYAFLGAWEGGHYPPGEVQVFGDYAQMLTDARVTRQTMLPRLEGLTPARVSDEICMARARRSERRLKAGLKAQANARRSGPRREDFRPYRSRCNPRPP